MTQVENGYGEVTTTVYDAARRDVRQLLANGAKVTTSYDAADRITRVWHAKATGALIALATYTYDNAGRKTSVSLDDGTQSTYDYDDSNQLVEEVHTPAGMVTSTKHGVQRMTSPATALVLNDNGTRTKVRRHETTEHGHGRDEARTYFICPVPDDLPDRERWAGLKAIGLAIGHTLRDGKECLEVRYYILSRYLSGRRFAEAVRTHWAIENRLHWQLDVTFQEDQSRIRKGHADANFSSPRRTALSLLKNEPTAKVGIKNKRLTAGWDEAYLEKVLLGT